jgi:cellulose synthase/poly-beta-1,6-N-acetylglucosamine synthase-like glycosyltransferase
MSCEKRAEDRSRLGRKPNAVSAALASLSSFVLVAFFAVQVGLAIYALHIFFLTSMFWRKRRVEEGRPPVVTPSLEGPWPAVTVQLPVFNESTVVERLIDAVAGLDYPRDRLDVQVLDDSTDETTELATAAVERARSRGLDITLIRRPDRLGFKAGALAYGMRTARGEHVALFDADFVPPPDFLRQTVPVLAADPRLAFVQTRWGHLNRDYSMVTRMQSLAIDSHFSIDQAVRCWANLPMHFNGAAGVWRRAAIDDCGGWQGDTLCEDLDLSYRALLRGWRPAFREDIVVPAELSPQLAAFKQQQFRWAKGSIQCWKKLWTPILGSWMPWWKKAIALVHVSGYFISLMMFLTIVLTPIFAATVSVSGGVACALGALSTGSLCYPVFYALAMRGCFPDRWVEKMATELPFLMLVGCGMTLNNTLGVIDGLSGSPDRSFHRTPKFNVVRGSDRWEDKAYRLPIGRQVLGELALGLYCLAGCLVVAWSRSWLLLPVMCFYTVSFLVQVWLCVWEVRRDLWMWARTRLSARSA